MICTREFIIFFQLLAFLLVLVALLVLSIFLAQRKLTNRVLLSFLRYLMCGTDLVPLFLDGRPCFISEDVTFCIITGLTTTDGSCCQVGQCDEKRYKRLGNNTFGRHGHGRRQCWEKGIEDVELNQILHSMHWHKQILLWSRVWVSERWQPNERLTLNVYRCKRLNENLFCLEGP